MSVRWLVVNADDFGHSAQVNAGVARGHVAGIVTSASLMVDAPAAQAAVELAARNPALGLGLHVDLGEWEQRDGEWHANYVMVDDDDPDAVTAEVERQVERFRELVGADPQHLDSHQHVHREEPARTVLKGWSQTLGVPLRHHGGARYCGAFYGQGRAGEPLPDAITAAALATLIVELPEGVTELCCHPAAAAPPRSAYAAERPRELAALCDGRVRAAVIAAGVRLGTFGEALGRAAGSPPAHR